MSEEYDRLERLSAVLLSKLQGKGINLEITRTNEGIDEPFIKSRHDAITSYNRSESDSDEIYLLLADLLIARAELSRVSKIDALLND